MFQIINYKDSFLKLQMCIDGARLGTQMVQIWSLRVAALLYHLPPDFAGAPHSRAVTDQEQGELERKGNKRGH